MYVPRFLAEKERMSLTFKDYQFIESLHTGQRTRVFRCRRPGEEKTFVIKILRNDLPNRDLSFQFKKEFELLTILEVDGVIKAHAFEEHDGVYAMLLEDIGGMSIDLLAPAKHLSLTETLRVGISLTKTLGRLHRRGFIHGDLNPSNIVYNPMTGQTRIIDFSLAAATSRGILPNVSFRLSQESLAYMSPEMTGRTGRRVDYRSDYYSLGATLYLLLCHHQPYLTSDTLELVHAHVARSCPAPVEINPSVPLPLSAVVEKLLSKDPEERYQSSRGLIADLEECLLRMSRNGTIEDFHLGRMDFRERFVIPRRLRGREEQLKQLTELVNQAVHGAKAGVFVSGEPGVGKTSLVMAMRDEVCENLAWFGAGKFDQLRRETGRSALFSAFGALIRQVLALDDSVLEWWTKRTRDALGSDAQLLVDAIPELALVLGPQPPAPKLPPMELSNRFNYLFTSLVKVFCTPGRPLVLFLDDLQWVDRSSRTILEVLASDDSLQSLLIIGAYRDTEVRPTHDFKRLNERLSTQNMPWHHIHLDTLNETEVTSFTAETVCRPSAEAVPLAKVVMRHTRGNPFAIEEFLKAIYSEGLLALDSDNCAWKWDLSRLSEKAIGERAIAFAEPRMRGWDARTRELLWIIATMGSTCDLNRLSIAAQLPRSEIAQSLDQALEDGLLIAEHDPCYGGAACNQDSTASWGIYYRFAHDRIQQMAHSLIPEQDFPSTHWRVGQRLLAATPPDSVERYVAEIVDQLNEAIDLVEAQPGRDDLARLNLMAGKRSVAVRSYHSALHYFMTGMRLLGDDCWSANSELVSELYLEAIRSACLNGDHDATDSLSSTFLRYETDPTARTSAYEAVIHSMLSRNDLRGALKTSLLALEELGLRLPEKPNKLHIVKGFLTTKLALSGKNPEDLVAFPIMTDPKTLAVLRLLSSTGAAAYMFMPELLPLMVFEIIKLTLKFGNAGVSAHAYSTYGLLLNALQGDVNGAYDFGILGTRLAKLLDANEHAGRALFIFNYCVRHWKDHLKDTIAPLREAYDIGIRYGDIEFACRSMSAASVNSYFSGLPIDVIERDLETACSHLKALKQEPLLLQTALYLQVVRNLMGNSEAPMSLNGEWFNARDALPLMSESGDKSKLFHIHVNKLILCYLFGDYHSAVQGALEAEKSLEGMRGTYAVAIFYFYDSLARLAALGDQPRSIQKTWLKKVASNQKKMVGWARQAPMNYRHKYQLVEAERMRVLGKEQMARDLYFTAASGAEEHQYLNEAALANELALEFALKKGVILAGNSHFKQALRLYSLWGAHAKVNQLQGKYYPWFGQTDQVSVKRERYDGRAVPSRVDLDQELDMATVVKASQSLSGEITVAHVLERIMRIAIEYAGAERGAIVLKSDGNLLVRGKISVDISSEPVIESTPLARASDLAISVVNFVMRTQDPLVLDDALRDPMFSYDPYIKSRGCRSVLCVPLVFKGELSGVIYLENNLASHAFTQERVNVLKMLCTQAAISLENATLYENMESVVASRTAELQSANSRLNEQIQEKELARQALLEAKLQADAANLAKSEFLANMSHELRTPLNAVIGFAELLQDQWPGPLNEKQSNFTGEIVESGRHLLSLINEILDMAKIESGKLELQLSQFRVGDLVARSLTFVKEAAVKQGVEIYNLLEPEVESLTIVADETKLKQVLVNLLANSVKFTPSGGKVQLRSVLETDSLVLQVIDTGIGLKPEDKERIFKPFEQVDSSLARKHHGTGLGLSLARNLVELHGGSIWATSEGIDKGSTFTFVVPLGLGEKVTGEEPEKALPKRTQSLRDPDARRDRDRVPTVMVVEDNESNMKVTTSLLEANGYTVLQAQDAIQGLEMARTELPDLILMDLTLPGMDGLTAIGIIKGDERTRHIPVIAVTAHAMQDDMAKALEAGCDDYVPKPIDQSRLLNTIERFVSSLSDG